MTWLLAVVAFFVTAFVVVVGLAQWGAMVWRLIRDGRFGRYDRAKAPVRYWIVVTLCLLAIGGFVFALGGAVVGSVLKIAQQH